MGFRISEKNKAKVVFNHFRYTNTSKDMPTVKKLKQICRDAGLPCSGTKAVLEARIAAAKRDGTAFPSIKHTVCPKIRADLKRAHAARLKEDEAKRTAVGKLRDLDALIADAQRQRNAWYVEYKRAETASSAARFETNRLMDSCRASCESAGEPCLMSI